MKKQKNIQFVYMPGMNDVEMVGNRYNVDFQGKRRNEAKLRKYILSRLQGNYAELNTMQLLVLMVGGSYEEAIGMA